MAICVLSSVLLSRFRRELICTAQYGLLLDVCVIVSAPAGEDRSRSFHGAIRDTFVFIVIILMRWIFIGPGRCCSIQNGDRNMKVSIIYIHCASNKIDYRFGLAARFRTWRMISTPEVHNTYIHTYIHTIRSYYEYPRKYPLNASIKNIATNFFL